MVIKGKNILIHRFTRYTHEKKILYSIAMSIQKYSNLPMEGINIIQRLVRVPIILIMPQNVLDVLYNVAPTTGLVLDIVKIA